MNIGSKVARLMAIKYLGVVKGHRMMLFRCDCGAEKVLRISSVRSGNDTTCGCKIGKPCKHGLSYSPLYHVWDKMMRRCYDPLDPSYPDYGGRGITVCHTWHDLATFVKDVSPKPVGLSLDREDNSKGYSKDNFRWATPKEQQLNTRRTQLYTLNGVTDSQSGWALRVGMYQGTLSRRLRKGMSFEEAIKNGS